TGTVSVEGGALSVTASGSSSGAFTLVGGNLQLNGTSIICTLQNGASITGAGAVQVNTFNTLSIAGGPGGSNATVQNLNLAGGAIIGAGNLTVTGRLAWASGTTQGPGRFVIGPTGTLAINGTFLTLNRGVDNSGTATLAPGSSVTLNGVTWNNLPGGVLDS